MDLIFLCNGMLLNRKTLSGTAFFQIFIKKNTGMMHILGFPPWCLHMSSYHNCHFFSIMFGKGITPSATSKLNFLGNVFNNYFQGNSDKNVRKKKPKHTVKSIFFKMEKTQQQWFIKPLSSSAFIFFFLAGPVRKQALRSVGIHLAKYHFC